MVQDLNETLMEKDADSVEINMQQHSTFRNFIIILTVIRTSCRPCVLANMTIQEFQNRMVKSEKGMTKHIIQVSNHKTAATLGAAFVFLTPYLFNMYKVYINKVRPYLLKNTNIEETPKEIFLTWHCQPVSSDDLGKGLTSIWKKCGLRSKIGFNLIRKTVTSAVHRTGDSEAKEKIAELQSHLPSTAEKWYRNQTKVDSLMESSNITYNIMTGSSENNDLPSCSKNILDSNNDISENKCSVTENFDNGVNFNENSKHRLINKWKFLVPPEFHKKGRGHFSHKQRISILSEFIQYVEEKEVPTLQKIRNVIKESASLNFINVDNVNHIKSLKGCLVNFVNKRNKFD